MLKRYGLFLQSEKIDYLKSINGISVSEHTRRAIDIYIKSLKPEVSTSPSYERNESPAGKA
jgi:hypothetical protein